MCEPIAYSHNGANWVAFHAITARPSYKTDTLSSTARSCASFARGKAEYDATDELSLKRREDIAYLSLFTYVVHITSHLAR